MNLPSPLIENALALLIVTVKPSSSTVPVVISALRRLASNRASLEPVDQQLRENTNSAADADGRKIACPNPAVRGAAGDAQLRRRPQRRPAGGELFHPCCPSSKWLQAGRMVRHPCWQRTPALNSSLPRSKRPCISASCPRFFRSTTLAIPGTGFVPGQT